MDIWLKLFVGEMGKIINLYLQLLLFTRKMAISDL